jgi:glycosyltransferase involved in cell wall biosynthesis
VQSQVPTAKLHLAGDGPLRRDLALLAQKLGVQPSIQFHGAVGQSELRTLLRQSHVFCLPSRQEAFGIVLLEAMATGRPVVAARSSAIPEVVGECGVLVEPGRVDALAHALASLLLDSSRIQSLALAGRARAESFTWDRAAALFGSAVAEA